MLFGETKDEIRERCEVEMWGRLKELPEFMAVKCDTPSCTCKANFELPLISTYHICGCCVQVQIEKKVELIWQHRMARALIN